MALSAAAQVSLAFALGPNGTALAAEIIDAINGQGALASGNIIVGNAGGVAADVAMSGDVTISNTGVTTIGAKKVVETMIAIADGKIFVGDAGGDASAVTPSGDVTITNTGVTAIGAGKVTNAMVAPAALDGTVAKVVANANVIGGIPLLHQVNIADAVSGDTDVVLTHKTRVIDAWVVLTAAGDAANTYTVKNGANAITDAITPGATDTTLKSAGQINDANHEIAAAGTLRVSHVKVGGSSAAIVYVLGIRVA